MSCSSILGCLSRSSSLPRVLRRRAIESSLVMELKSSGGSEESDPLPVDLMGDPVFAKALVLRSARPEVLDVVEELCDCD